MRVWLWAWCAVWAFAALPAATSAEPAGAGARIEAIELLDQHGVPRVVDAGTKVVLLSRDMEGGGLLREALTSATAEQLEARGIAYLADLHGMPRLVARLFAIPSMRRRPYPMLLDRDGQATASLPTREGAATLVFLDALRVDRVLHVRSADAVRSALGLGTNEAP